MGKYSKLREKILAGGADGNVEFAELCKLLVRLGFVVRVKGGHHISLGMALPRSSIYNSKAIRPNRIQSNRSGVFL